LRLSYFEGLLGLCGRSPASLSPTIEVRQEVTKALKNKKWMASMRQIIPSGIGKGDTK